MQSAATATNKNMTKASGFWACLAIVIFMVMMLVRPDFYLASARRGLALFATSVLPSLFPFYFFSLLLTQIGAAKTVSTLFEKPVRALYRTPKESAYVLIISMLSGYPVGASMTSELFEAGVLDEKDAKSVCAFASTSGPVFMLGTIGSAIFKNTAIGAIVLASHYLASLLNGIIFRQRKKKQDDAFRPARPTPPCDFLLSNAISKSTMTMLCVGVYIVICGMLADTLSLLRLDEMILSSLGEKAGMPVVSLLFGMIEMTRGAILCAECSPAIGTALCSAIVSLGGLSVTLQCHTFLSKCHISLFEILLRKVCQASIAFLLALAFSALFFRSA